jgi:hypothetical protein
MDVSFRRLDADYRSLAERIQRSPGLPVNNPTISFWTIPPAILPALQAPSAGLPSHVDVLVIGSGITGVSCTLNTGPSNLRVLVLEARDVCSGATGR